MKHNHNHDGFREYITKPIILKLSPEEEILRQELMDIILDTHEPLDISQHPQKELIQSLAERNILAMEDKKIHSIYPVSAQETNKKVYLADGRFGYAMCAIDAIGFHYCFKQDIRIEGECQKCGEKLLIEVQNGRIVDPDLAKNIYVLHTDLNNSKTWSCSCCCIMHFFSCKDALEDWVSKNELSSKHYPVNLEEANKIAWLLFSC